MKITAQLTLLSVILIASTATFATPRARRLVATCTGSTPCRACKNCRYCKHCAKEGGTCGVCRRRAEDVAKSWEGATERLASTRNHSH
jgi:hypothetical protein